MPSCWALLGDMQFLHGYSILLADPPVTSLNDLAAPIQTRYLADTVFIGDALMEVTPAFRINYAIMGNRDPYLHAHIVPRYLAEPDEYRLGLPWSYPHDLLNITLFDYERDRELKQQLGAAIQKRL
jgi:diadenosine tetraphosphate (Ap4A) HIT family hydrolase